MVNFRTLSLVKKVECRQGYMSLVSLKTSSKKKTPKNTDSCFAITRCSDLVQSKCKKKKKKKNKYITNKLKKTTPCRSDDMQKILSFSKYNPLKSHFCLTLLSGFTASNITGLIDSNCFFITHTCFFELLMIAVARVSVYISVPL